MDSTKRHAELRSRCVNVADQRLGAMALFATDEFFAPTSRMLSAEEPEWRAGVYDEHGKWMDGWETRRRRDQGHDYCVIRLAAPATLALLEIDTRYFTGNFPPYASVQACQTDAPPDADTVWHELLTTSGLLGNQNNAFEVDPTGVWTHLKLNIFPDGGVARFRAYGRVYTQHSQLADGESIDLASALNGGRALACSDEHYGSMRNLLLPGRGVNMADGWETRRRREPGYDWVVLRLGHLGRVAYVEIDTAHFKGNFPHQISINGARVSGDMDSDLSTQCLYWPVLLEPHLLQADHVVRFETQLRDIGCISHVRVNIHPDGGLSRVRVFGSIETGSPAS